MAKLWYFHTAASTPSGGALTRPYDFCKQFNKKGFETKIFTSAYNHYTSENIDTPSSKYVEKKEDGVDFIYVRIIDYASNGIKRVLSMFSYMFNVISVAKKYAKKNGKPDIILASSPHPLSLVAGIQVAKKLKIPCIIEVRDLWPESVVAYSTRFSKSNPLIKLLYAGEKWLYKKADALIFTMPGGIDYIKEQKWDKDLNLSKVFNVNNGVDLKEFDYNKETYITTDDDLNNQENINFIYAGSIRKVHNVGILLDAAKYINNPKVKILIWGDGNELSMLKQRLIDENIKNVIFKGRVDKKKLPHILSKAHANILHCKTSPVLNLGISNNKTFDYLASAKPILSTFDFRYNFITDNNAGACVKEQTPQSIANAFEQMAKLSEDEYAKMCQNARQTAEEFDIEVLSDKFIDIINHQL